MSRTRNWSGSTLAQWLRSQRDLPARPNRGTTAQWKSWELTERQQAPRLHWFLEVFLDRLERFVYWPVERLEDFRFYISNRFVYRTHVVRTGLKAGSWSDTDARLLNASMQLLVDFVEIELAHMQFICREEGCNSKYWCKPRWWKPFRCPQAGIDHLIEMTSLQHPEQAASAHEILAIYQWWTIERPTRADPMIESGLSEIYDLAARKNEDTFDSDWHPDGWDEAVEKDQKIERMYLAEDENMLIRLIKVRQKLWT